MDVDALLALAEEQLEFAEGSAPEYQSSRALVSIAASLLVIARRRVAS